MHSITSACAELSVSDGKIISGLRTCLREIKPLSEEVKMHRKVKKKRKTSDNVEKERRDGGSLGS